MQIEICDTTLRDGEQTSGVAFTAPEKLNIAKMLLSEIKIDRIEVASARVSSGEFEAAKMISSWAKEADFLERVEILGFVDGIKSIEWIKQAGGRYLNLLCKGSLLHVEAQLKKTPKQHVDDIKAVIAAAKKEKLLCNIYLEDWSNGMKSSPDYVFFLLDSLQAEPIERFMLPDTLGILNPDQTYDFIKKTIDKLPEKRFDFHAHNDYDLAVANTLAAVRAGVRGVHTTVNGLGERTGNAPLASVAAALKDHLNVKPSIDEQKLMRVCSLVEAFSGIRIPSNKPVTGEHVFTQTCGVHADGDSKGNLYYNDLLPERFGRKRKYALGKTSGKASIRKNLEELGIELDNEAMKKITERVIELGDKKENITTEDLPFIIADVLGTETTMENVKIINYQLCQTHGLKPVASLSIEINGKVYEQTSSGDGQYDAFMKALTLIAGSLDKTLPELIDYEVTIPPGGKTDALVETVITWKLDRNFKTRGLDSDQSAAAIKATLKMLNLVFRE
ncbi:MAG: 2-isopropylmalate synthase [Spirochaetes bacterium GWF1_41_5]|nr:MAG: 2-isopropylmalate synthase [Spirochaetes bacterium GWF1_41_5]